ARSNGDAIGIGHPHGATLTALEQWVGQLKARGFSLVPVSTVLRHRAGEFTAPPPRNLETIASN
uniref:divergent polysaccharide deacetylase family protein n=1 Tax=Ferrovibrio sp. TaxID=1917215 RepID=UPI001B413FBA